MIDSFCHDREEPRAIIYLLAARRLAVANRLLAEPREAAGRCLSELAPGKHRDCRPCARLGAALEPRRKSCPGRRNIPRRVGTVEMSWWESTRHTERMPESARRPAGREFKATYPRREAGSSRRVSYGGCLLRSFFEVCCRRETCFADCQSSL